MHLQQQKGTFFRHEVTTDLKVWNRGKNTSTGGGRDRGRKVEAADGGSLCSTVEKRSCTVRQVWISVLAAVSDYDNDCYLCRPYQMCEAFLNSLAC
jgi:hypothetical protein